MSRKEVIPRYFAALKNPLYLNANIIYSEALNYIRQEHWKRKIKGGTIGKLRQEGFDLTTSILTRMEVIQRLNREENIPLGKAREVYHAILGDNQIVEITGIHKHIELNDPYLDNLVASNLDFKDALHLTIAKKLNMPVCTHDKKIRGEFSQQAEKSRFYERVFKPEELIKPRR